MNGASSFKIECAHADRYSDRDIMRSNVPIVIAVTILVFAVGAAFHVGGLYNDLNKERSEILERLDGIEGAIRKFAPSYTPPAHKRARARGTPSDQG